MPAPIVVSGGTTSATGTTLQTIRTRLAPTLGLYQTGNITTQAASLDADRVLISTDLTGDQTTPKDLDGLYAFVRGGLEARSQRQIVDGSYDGPIGAVAVDLAYGSGPLLVGTAFELSVLPAIAYGGASGLNDCIYLGLETLSLIDWISLTVTTDAATGLLTTQYDLTTQAWPIKGVQAVYYPRTSATTAARREMPKVWTYESDAESTMLSFRSLPAKSGDVIDVRVLRPATTRIKSGGVWGDSTTGLVAEADACLYSANAVVAAARPFALERLALLKGRGSKAWASLQSEAAEQRTAARLTRWFGQKRGSGAQRVGAVGQRR